MTSAALELSGISKNFGSVQVSRDISLTLMEGARYALIGPNGAGKTTLVNIITGLVRPTKGTVRLGGLDITSFSVERRVTAGLVRTFQITSLFLNLTVAENIVLALCARHGVDSCLYDNLRNRADLIAEAHDVLERLRILELAKRTIADLAYGQRRLVELAVAVSLRPKILLLDEPAAGLPSTDRKVLLDLLLELPKSISILLVEHDMSLVFRFVDRIAVLVEGALLTEGSPAEIRENPEVRRVYLGVRGNA
jgi:branched-chain amino acid transport system ATP-binding protein